MLTPIPPCPFCGRDFFAPAAVSKPKAPEIFIPLPPLASCAVCHRKRNHITRKWEGVLALWVKLRPAPDAATWLLQPTVRVKPAPPAVTCQTLRIEAFLRWLVCLVPPLPCAQQSPLQNFSAPLFRQGQPRSAPPLRLVRFGAPYRNLKISCLPPCGFRTILTKSKPNLERRTFKKNSPFWAYSKTHLNPHICRLFVTVPPQVGRVGLEPTRCHHRRILSPLRLPVPPPPHLLFILYPNISPRQAFLIQDFIHLL